MGDDGNRADRVRRERDLYRRLLQLATFSEFDALLRETLALLVELVGATTGYIELCPDADGSPAVWAAHGLESERLNAVRATVSRGIIAETLAKGETLSTGSALDDPRFLSRESVRTLKIQAVLCVPVGTDPPRGVIYLQGRTERGPFTSEDQADTEVAAAQLARLTADIDARRRLAAAEDSTIPWRQRLAVDGLVGTSAAFAEVLRQTAHVAPLEVSVLLTGPSGTGKTQLARVIHDNSPRRRGRFVEINCGALPETLIESELFGAVAGAHSTALKALPGKVAAAEGGTLFLDEVAELPLTAQTKLLQLLNSREYYPLGGTSVVRADVRIIAATNSVLAADVAEKRFRADLYYRLAVVPIRLPTLQERTGDIQLLAARILTEASQRHGLSPIPLAASALRALESTEWPGNIRELGHALVTALIHAAGEDSPRIEIRHIFPDGDAPASNGPRPLELQPAMRNYQRQFVTESLEANDWNVSETARQLGVARSYLYVLIRGLGLKRRT